MRRTYEGELHSTAEACRGRFFVVRPAIASDAGQGEVRPGIRNVGHIYSQSQISCCIDFFARHARTYIFNPEVRENERKGVGKLGRGVMTVRGKRRPSLLSDRTCAGCVILRSVLAEKEGGGGGAVARHSARRQHVTWTRRRGHCIRLNAKKPFGKEGYASGSAVSSAAPYCSRRTETTG